MASGVPNTCVRWMWKANSDPFSDSEPATWELYSDVENIIIEDAFQAGQSHAVLDTYSINFKRGIQILNYDGKKQRPIKREIINRADQPPRKERFTFTPIDPDRPFAGLYETGGIAKISCRPVPCTAFTRIIPYRTVPPDNFSIPYRTVTA
ncbi:unnamed protein product [Adineta steineri]|uniref:WWE domain-containing protein n=1 Tax=Adineta steineri TaxID=433720 RepID=A0A815SDP4_9BILA|nr:unnamed protein product [Adineta steineri]CAF1490794.1 unnamed protein product [Adineta steineri]CAF4058342.1 unnamed protein product [Adineta steineri]CAF4085485.1 unnamed protein product [Adineta steineri]